MRRSIVVLSILIAALMMALQPAAAAPPGQFTAAIDGLGYTDFGSTTRAQQRLISISGLRAVGQANCNGDGACLATGINGQSIEIAQDLQIVIDVIGAGVVAISGQTQGTVATTLNSGQISRSFTGAVDGTASCSAGICDITLSVLGRGPRAGLVRLNLIGQLDLTGASPVWIVLEGAGIVSTADADMI